MKKGGKGGTPKDASTPKVSSKSRDQDGGSAGGGGASPPSPPPSLVAEFNPTRIVIGGDAKTSRSSVTGSQPSLRRTPGSSDSPPSPSLPFPLASEYALLHPRDVTSLSLLPEDWIVVIGKPDGEPGPRPLWIGQIWPHKCVEGGCIRIPSALTSSTPHPPPDTTTTATGGEDEDITSCITILPGIQIQRIPDPTAMPPSPPRVSLHVPPSALPLGYRHVTDAMAADVVEVIRSTAISSLRRCVMGGTGYTTLLIPFPSLPTIATTRAGSGKGEQGAGEGITRTITAASTGAPSPTRSTPSRLLPVPVSITIPDPPSRQVFFPLGGRDVTRVEVRVGEGTTTITTPTTPSPTTPSTDDVVTGSSSPLPSPGHGSPPPIAGGLPTEVEELITTIKSSLFTPETYTSLGLCPVRGCLLSGPPGTGKTLCARVISARLGVPLHIVNGPEVLSPVIGAAEAELRRIFEDAGRDGPGLLFLDEVDGLAPRREGAGEVEARVVATLLTLMDGIASHPPGVNGGKSGPVFVLAATNRPGAVDPALRRPGRFDLEVLMGVPTEQQRGEILKACLSGYPHTLSPHDIIGVSRKLHGYVGADIAAVCREASLAALGRLVGTGGGGGEEVAITLGDLQKGVNLVQPSAIREIQVEVPHVRWGDIGGQEETKERLKEAVEWPLTHPEVFTALGIRPPKGVLLFGPPGCSKTMMAKAMATESSMNFIAIKGPELFSKYVGDSEKAVADVFRKARAASPCILFFDEFDAMAGTRGDDGGGGSSVATRVVSQMLQELDGIQALKQVVVVAATNRPDLIDPALLRPGRIDRMLYVGPPDAPARHHIISLHLARIPHANSDGEEGRIDLPTIVDALEGYSGAEIVAIMKEAAGRAVHEYRSSRAGEAVGSSSNGSDGILNISSSSSSGGGSGGGLSSLKLRHHHVIEAARGMPRQITKKMLAFYAGFMKG